jgi:mRNA interferase MazF
MQRGEVWLVDLGYLAKVRPALILSLDILDTDRALATVIPYTTSTRGTRFEVPILVPFLRAGAFDAQNLITVSIAKFQHRLGTLTPDELNQVELAVRFWLGL